MKGTKGLITGVANEHSIAWGCAKALHQAGSSQALTYLNEKSKPYVAPLAESVNAEIFMPLDVTNQDMFDSLFQEITARWGKLDYLLHSMAFATKDDLHGRVTDCSRDGFMNAMDVSCYSLNKLVKPAEPLMAEGGSIVTMSYYGAEKVVPNYNMMGPVKAALESTVRYLAMELGPKKIRVNALSPGPVRTRAAQGLSGFDDLLGRVYNEAPIADPVTIEQIGESAAFLMSDKAQHITGQVIYIDGGYNIRG